MSAASHLLQDNPENRIVWNLDPTQDTPRNSEGAFITLKSGRILFIYTQFYGGYEDNSPSQLVSIHSEDGGQTWSQEPRVVVENAGAENTMSVSLLRLQSDRLAFFYAVRNGLHDVRPRLRISTDEAESWSEPQPIIEAPGYFVLNNDRVVQLSNGRLILPAAFHRQRGYDATAFRGLDFRAIAFWFLSDDEGQSWREADTWWALPAVTSSGLQEPGVVELADGRLFSWARTDQGCQYGFTSADSGRSWSAPMPTSLQSPVSPASIKRLPDFADLLTVYNDHSGSFAYVPGKRTPLVTAISSDGGQTWPIRKLIEDDMDGWYCYTAIHYVEDAVLLAYCAGDPSVGGLNRLRIRRLRLDWLRQEEA
jgi:hypothetical protein